MRKSQTRQIGEVILDLLKEMQIDRKLREVSLINQWEAIMGKMVSSRTSNIYIRNKILYVQLTSSVLKTELLMMRQQIIDRLNENAKDKLIENIVIR